MRKYWAHTRRHWHGEWPRRPAASDYDSETSCTSPTWPTSSTTPHQRPIPDPSPPHRVVSQPASPARARPSLVCHAA